jgi:hypothetical protein
VFLPDGPFLPLPKLATEPFLKLWEQQVFALLLTEGKITEEVVQGMRSWKHSGEHIPDPGELLICYYGWYSNRRRGQRAK